MARPADATSPTGRDRAGRVHALLLGSAYAAIGALRVRNRWAGALDLGVFDQGMWLLAQGHAPEVTVIGDNLFADHLSPVLLCFAPLYRIAASPYWLVVVQGFALGLTVLPLRAFAADLGLPRRVASLAVAGSAPLLAAAVYDFHPIVLATPAIAWAVLLAHRDDPRRLTAAALVVAFMRADAVWILVGVAIVAGPRCRRRLAILVPPVLLLAVAAPAILDTSRQRFGRIYPSLGSDPLDALTHPWRAATTAFSAPTLTTLAIWLVPVGFAIVLRPRWLAAVLVAGAPFLLSSIPGISQPWFYYAAVFSPLVLCGAMDTLANAHLDKAVRVLWVAGAVVALALTSPLSANAPSGVRMTAFVVPREVPGLEEAYGQVRPGDAVSADFDLLTPLVHRDRAYVMPCPFEDVPGEELCARADRSGRDVDVVITRQRSRSLLEAHGFVVRELPGGELVIGRRPT